MHIYLYMYYLTSSERERMHELELEREGGSACLYMRMCGSESLRERVLCYMCVCVHVHACVTFVSKGACVGNFSRSLLHVLWQAWVVRHVGASLSSAPGNEHYIQTKKNMTKFRYPARARDKKAFVVP